MRTPLTRALVALLPLTLLVAACGDDDTTASSGAVGSSTTTMAGDMGDTGAGGHEATVTVEGDAPQADTTIDVTVEGGDVIGGGKHQVSVGDLVTLRVTADVDDEVHVHGYDLMHDVSPGSPATITFTADIPGQFEVELEGAGIPLVQLVVS